VRTVEVLESSYSEKESTGAAYDRIDQSLCLDGPKDDMNNVVAIRGSSSRRKAEAGVMRRFSRRALRGLAIVAKGEQIERIGMGLFLVKSQSSPLGYHIIRKDDTSQAEWYCDCEDFEKRMKPCKHVYAVLFVLALPHMVSMNFQALVGESVE
jgi:hypothetical protein